MNKFGNSKANQNQYPFTLPQLPYETNSLEPYMTAETFSFHYGKHHQTYVTNLNNLLVNHELKNNDLEAIIKSAHDKEQYKSIYNNAAQVWNHSFFWHSLKSKGGGQPHGKLAKQIERDFESYDKFKEEFKSTGLAQFGSGWVWLVYDGTKLSIIKTANADLPLTKDLFAIITSDVWEHAYYLDYQNRRADYLVVFLENLVNWDFAEENFINSLN